MRSFIAIALATSVPTFVSGATLTVNVGANSQLSFDPPSMNASVGDTVNFVFQSKNHSVIGSSFANPCTSIATFASPFFPVNNSAGPFPAYVVNITSQEPIWFYCAQTIPINHCMAGMVGAINPPQDKTFAQFQANAMGNLTTNSTSTGSSTGSPTGSSSPSATAKNNSAVRMGGGVVALLTVVSIIAGITTL